MIACRDVHLAFGDTPALRGVSVRLADGEVVGLLGPNGAGKTTLIRVLHLLVDPDRGRVLWDGREVAADDLQVRRRMALVAQKPHLFQGDVRDNLALPLRVRGWPKDRIARRVDEVADRFGLDRLVSRPVRKLSGGQVQRVAFARALAPGPDVLYLDEFTSNLDRRHRDRLTEAVAGFVAEGGAAVVAGHDASTIARLADRVVVLERGCVADRGPAKEVLDRHQDAL